MERSERTGRDLFPVSLSIDGETVIVIGGGRVAERKIEALVSCGARVTVIAPLLSDAVTGLVADGRVTHHERVYERGDLAGAFLAISAVDDEALGASVSAEARELNIPVNVVDRPELCTFAVPAVARRGRLMLAVSTGGASPAWAGLIKSRLLNDFGEEYARLFDALASVRRRCMETISDPERRGAVLRRLADESLVRIARDMDRDALEEELWRRINEWMKE